MTRLVLFCVVFVLIAFVAIGSTTAESFEGMVIE